MTRLPAASSGFDRKMRRGDSTETRSLKFNNKYQSYMNLDEIRALMRKDLDALDTTIRRRLSSDVLLVNQVAEYIIAGGGKRLRPLLVITAAGACGYEGPHHVDGAAIIEFIHTATLLHDDVVDASELRRGRTTANSVFGNEASVLVGDFLYSRAFQMMNDIGNLRVLNVIADATNMIAEGEVLQLMNCGDPDTTEIRYLEVIKRKTAGRSGPGGLRTAAGHRLPTGGRRAGLQFQRRRAGQERG
jgi:octaprenyl-diphosphate synthase